MRNQTFFISIVLFFLFSFFNNSNLFAQDNQVIHSKKSSHLGQRKQKLIENLGIEPKDTAAFFELFRAYKAAKKVNKQDLKKNIKNLRSKEDNQLSEIFDEIKALKAESLDINNDYFEKFKNILTLRQMSVLIYEIYELKQRYIKMSKK